VTGVEQTKTSGGEAGERRNLLEVIQESGSLATVTAG